MNVASLSARNTIPLLQRRARFHSTLSAISHASSQQQHTTPAHNNVSEHGSTLIPCVLTDATRRQLDTLRRALSLQHPRRRSNRATTATSHHGLLSHAGVAPREREVVLAQEEEEGPAEAVKCDLMSPSEIIQKKRNGAELSHEEIQWFIGEFHNGGIKDYQMAAFLMAICVRSMSNQEAMDMTNAMVDTGIKAANVRPLFPNASAAANHNGKAIVVDKHSTGGVGDKCSMVLTPLASALGLVVPMLCGHGLGHTGGTIDKIGTIPNISTDLSTEQYLSQLETVGCVIAQPNANFAPVDKRMYSLRDVTGSSDNVALVASSIMSKKIAESPDALLLDVKTGKGAFFPRWVDAVSLAQTMVAIGEDAGISTRCILSSMDQPLGSAVGNWLEVREAIQVLSAGRVHVEDPTNDDLLEEVRELALTQAAMMLQVAGRASTFGEGWHLASDMLESGECLAQFAKMVEAQGGDSRVVFDPDRMPLSNVRCTYTAPTDCVIQSIDAYEVGMASLWSGAGRLHAEDCIDPHAGFLFHAKVGDSVKKGDPLFTAFVGSESVPTLADPVERLEKGFRRAVESIDLVKEQPDLIIPKNPLVEYVVDKYDTVPFFEYVGK